MCLEKMNIGYKNVIGFTKKDRITVVRMWFCPNGTRWNYIFIINCLNIFSMLIY